MELKPKSTGDEKPGFREKLEEPLGALLDPGESILGVCAASQQKGVFSSGVVALVATDRRLIVQTLDRKGRIKDGEYLTILPDEIDSVKVGGLGGGDSPSSILMDSSTTKVKIKLARGEKLKFAFMHGGGMLGLLGGGASQAEGAAAVMEFLGESEASI